MTIVEHHSKKLTLTKVLLNLSLIVAPIMSTIERKERIRCTVSNIASSTSRLTCTNGLLATFPVPSWFIFNPLECKSYQNNIFDPRKPSSIMHYKAIKRCILLKHTCFLDQQSKSTLYASLLPDPTIGLSGINNEALVCY